MPKINRGGIFQSTFPLQGTTNRVSDKEREILFQSTFPLQGTTVAIETAVFATLFQSTFPLQGTTPPLDIALNTALHFNPRSHCRERLHCETFSTRKTNFNPRSHCRERRVEAIKGYLELAFQSTFPLQGTTWTEDGYIPNWIFQSTFPLQGTTVSGTLETGIKVFQSTFPLQGTTAEDLDKITQTAVISIHVPIAGNDEGQQRYIMKKN